MRWRTKFSRRAVRNLIVLSVLFEVCTRFPPPAPLVFFVFPSPYDWRWSGDATGGFARLWIRGCSICYRGGEFAHSMLISSVVTIRFVMGMNCFFNFQRLERNLHAGK